MTKKQGNNNGNQRKTDKPVQDGITFINTDDWKYWRGGNANFPHDSIQDCDNVYSRLKDLILDVAEFISNTRINDSYLEFGLADGSQVAIIARNKFGQKAAFRTNPFIEDDARLFYFDHRPKRPASPDNPTLRGDIIKAFKAYDWVSRKLGGKGLNQSELREAEEEYKRDVRKRDEWRRKYSYERK